MVNFPTAKSSTAKNSGAVFMQKGTLQIVVICMSQFMKVNLKNLVLVSALGKFRKSFMLKVLELQLLHFFCGSLRVDNSLYVHYLN